MMFTKLMAIAMLASAWPVGAAELVAPYVQTVAEDVELILDLADVQPSDYVIDLGSGDGRFVIAAGRRGALAHGVELNPELVELATKNSIEAGVADRVTFVEGDIFAAEISAATVVTLYLFPEANIKLRPKLLAQLRPGTRVVSNSFHMGQWQPDARSQGRTSGGALLWYIPADVRGTWELSVDTARHQLVLQQEFQQVISALREPKPTLELSAIELTGRRIRFNGYSAQASYTFDGHVEDGRMQGIAHEMKDNLTRTLSWQAERVPAPDLSKSPPHPPINPHRAHSPLNLTLQKK